LTLNSTVPESTTNFYIRCKDQPGLEGKEDDTYKRNTDQSSKIYTLKSSPQLEISSFSLNRDLILGPSTQNTTLTIQTSGGSESGRAECRWRLMPQISSWVLFGNTNSSTHTQTLTNLQEQDYEVEVVCSDTVGNIATQKNTLRVRIDNTPPLVIRLYNDKGSFKVMTNEPATCKFTNTMPGCFFVWDSGDATTMTGSSSVEHTTSWTKGKTYYVRCKDFYDNENVGCAVAAKAE